MPEGPFGKRGVEVIQKSERTIEGVTIEEHQVKTESFSMSTARIKFRFWGYNKTPLRKPSMYTVREFKFMGDRVYQAVVIVAHGEETRLEQIREAI